MGKSTNSTESSDLDEPSRPKDGEQELSSAVSQVAPRADQSLSSFKSPEELRQWTHEIPERSEYVIEGDRAQVLERIISAGGVLSLKPQDQASQGHDQMASRAMIADLGGDNQQSLVLRDKKTLTGKSVLSTPRFLLQADQSHFYLHGVADGMTGTGMLPLLYLKGNLEEEAPGLCRVRLQFVFARPRWAIQRWIGFLGTVFGGAAWVLLGGGSLAQRVLFFGAFVAITAPALGYDLIRGRRLKREKIELLNLMEGALGPLALSSGSGATPYRSSREGASNRQESDDDSEQDL